MRDLTPGQDLRLALLQTELVWHDPTANRAHFEQLLARVGEADLVILPAMFITGFSMESPAFAAADDRDRLWLE